MMQRLTTTALSRLCRYHRHFGHKFPSYGKITTYHVTPNENWLAAFWTGLLWLAYDATGDADCRQHAEELLPSFERRLDERIRLNHDLGFLFTLSARAQWQLTADEKARQVALRAADELLARFRPKPGYIQAWHAVGDTAEGGRVIVDGMLNIPLLFWATEQTGEERYRDAAIRHARTTAQYCVRPDGASYHSYFFDQATGQPLYARTHQGFSDESMWARGQSWVITGFAIAYEWTHDESFLQTAHVAAQRFMEELPDNNVPLWDFRLPPDAPTYPDSSAGAIAASGILRLWRLTGDDTYQQMALRLLAALNDHCFESDPEAHGLLRHGTLHAIKEWGLDTYQIFGDYFYLEALLMNQDKAPDFWGPTSSAP